MQVSNAFFAGNEYWEEISWEENVHSIQNCLTMAQEEGFPEVPSESLLQDLVTMWKCYIPEGM